MVSRTQYVDHVTYVVDCGQSNQVLHWYSKVFGMRRFVVGPAESLEAGECIIFCPKKKELITNFYDHELENYLLFSYAHFKSIIFLFYIYSIYFQIYFY